MAGPAGLGRPAVPERPKMRREVLVRRRTEGKARYYDLRLPDAQSVCSLYDFEMDLARKMNGGRDLDALVGEARALGLTLDRSMMEKFIRGLICYGLIETEPRPASATKQLAQLERELDELRHSMHKPSVPPPSANATYEAEGPSATSEAPEGEPSVANVKTELMDLATFPPAAQAEAPRTREPEHEPAAPEPNGQRWLVGGAIAAVAVAALVIVVLIAKHGRTPAPPAEAPVQLVAARVSGVVSQVTASQGWHVQQGAVLVVLVPDNWRDNPQVVPISQQLANAEQAVRRLTLNQAYALQAAQDRLATRTKELAALERKQRGNAAKLRRAREAVKSANANVEALRRKHAQQLAPLEGALEGHRAALERAQAEYGTVEVRAPVSGTVVTDPPSPQQRVKEGQTLFAIRSE